MAWSSVDAREFTMSTSHRDANGESAQISPLEHLKQLVHTHSPDSSTDWMSAPLLGQDVNFKTKVLTEYLIHLT